MSTIISPYVTYLDIQNFENPDIWYLKCLEPIDENSQNYNKSNPLDICDEMIVGSSDNLVSLYIEYPIVIVEEYSLAAIGIFWGFRFLYIVLLCLNYDDVRIYKVFIFLTILLSNSIMFSINKYTDKSVVCPMLEDTFTYLESDNNNNYPDNPYITLSKCEDLFIYSPRWLFIFPPINLGIYIIFLIFWLKSLED